LVYGIYLFQCFKIKPIIEELNTIIIALCDQNYVLNEENIMLGIYLYNKHNITEIHVYKLNKTVLSSPQSVLGTNYTSLSLFLVFERLFIVCFTYLYISYKGCSRHDTAEQLFP
jgi:hypothetical protein